MGERPGNGGKNQTKIGGTSRYTADVKKPRVMGQTDGRTRKSPAEVKSAITPEPILNSPIE